MLFYKCEINSEVRHSLNTEFSELSIHGVAKHDVIMFYYTFYCTVLLVYFCCFFVLYNIVLCCVVMFCVGKETPHESLFFSLDPFLCLFKSPPLCGLTWIWGEIQLQ